MEDMDKRKWRWGANPIMLLATGFGLGLSPVAPGTVGTLLGIPVVLAWRWLVFESFTLWEVGFAIVMTFLAVPICGKAESILKTHDDRRIVADEWMTFPICMLGLPVSWGYWWVLVLAFLTNRFFDILKPPPAYQLQSLKGGWGITMDDAMAALYSLMVNHAVFWLVSKWIG